MHFDIEGRKTLKIQNHQCRTTNNQGRQPTQQDCNVVGGPILCATQQNHNYTTAVNYKQKQLRLKGWQTTSAIKVNSMSATDMQDSNVGAFLLTCV